MPQSTKNTFTKKKKDRLSNMIIAYDSEYALIEIFLKKIMHEHDPLGINGFSREFDYRSGKTDIIFRSTAKKLICVEAKLFKWKDALHQAYRCSTFSHYSYVLLPWHCAQIAIKSKNEFDRRNVGLLTIENDQIRILIKPKLHIPLQPWLTESAFEQTEKEEMNESIQFAKVCG